jgi:hypothetical protein
MFKDFGGAYSSGSVQDSHLIPFSMLLPKGNGITKMCGKDTHKNGMALPFQKRMSRKSGRNKSRSCGKNRISSRLKTAKRRERSNERVLFSNRNEGSRL